MTPTATPAPIVTKLNRLIVTTLHDPAVRKQMLDQGIEPLPSTPTEMKARVDRELKDFSVLVKRAKLTIE
jgi:tripartite-type tricarboxylate transporter receptor subunit TctC